MDNQSIEASIALTLLFFKQDFPGSMEISVSSSKLVLLSVSECRLSFLEPVSLEPVIPLCFFSSIWSNCSSASVSILGLSCWRFEPTRMVGCVRNLSINASIHIYTGWLSVKDCGIVETVLWEPRTRDKSLLSQDSSVPAKCASKHNVGITQLQMLWLKSTMKNIHTRKMIPGILLCFFHKGFRCLSLVASCIYMNSSEVNCQMSLIGKSDWYIRNTKDEFFLRNQRKHK